jgi:hypothetical protein
LIKGFFAIKLLHLVSVVIIFFWLAADKRWKL